MPAKRCGNGGCGNADVYNTNYSSNVRDEPFLQLPISLGRDTCCVQLTPLEDDTNRLLNINVRLENLWLATDTPSCVASITQCAASRRAREIRKVPTVLKYDL